MGRSKVLSPEPELLDAFLLPNLRKSSAYKIDAPHVRVKLDQNETPFDWPEELKDAVLTKLKAQSWNRYPSPFTPELDYLLAEYAGVSPENILTGPGTNYILTIFLSALTRQLRGKLVIAQPSFPLYESHCRYEGVPYENWSLTSDFQYDEALLPEIPDHSLIVFASPNNPTGNVLPVAKLAKLLEKHRTSFILADEAYFEFASESYTSLLLKYPNLIIFRTCSKTLGAAGVRLGYALGSKEILEDIGKLRLPYLLNKFTIAAAEVFFKSTELQLRVGDHVREIVTERDRMIDALDAMNCERFRAFDSSANFFLVQLQDPSTCRAFYSGLIDEGILVRDVSRGPKLESCLRVTVGLPNENDQFLEATRKILKSLP